MDRTGLTLYRLDQWSSALGEWPIYPSAIEESQRNAGISYSATGCSFMIVNLMLDGELRYHCNGNSEYVVAAGEIFMIPVNSNYSFTNTSLKYYHKLVLEIKGCLLPAISETLQLNRPLLLNLESLNDFETEIREIGALLRAGQDKDVPLLMAKLHGLLSQISLIARAVPEDNMRILAKAKSRLENNFDGTLSIAGLAAELGICYSTLNKLFRTKLGISPLQYRTQQKIEAAKYFLMHTSLSIKEISIRLGYADQLYFSNDFKKNCNLSPRKFRYANCSKAQALS